MIHRLSAYVVRAYKPSFQLPLTISWAVGLTALFAATTDTGQPWRPDLGLVVTTLTVTVGMLLMRALDDIRDLDYDREVNPRRPLPSGQVHLRDLAALVAVGGTALVLLNISRGNAFLMLTGVMVYTGLVVALEIRLNWPRPDRLGLQLAVNLPIQTLLSLYVYVAYLESGRHSPTAAGIAILAAVTLAGLSLELGRKTTRSPRPGERTYVTVLGPNTTSWSAVSAAMVGTLIVVTVLDPWQEGRHWGWLVLLPLLLPVVAGAKFAAGATRWPLLPTLAYVPATYASFLAVGMLTTGGHS